MTDNHFYLSEYQVPDVIYPDFDNFEVKNETGEWRKHFYFTLEECKLEDFQETVRIFTVKCSKIWESVASTIIFSAQNFNMIVTNS